MNYGEAAKSLLERERQRLEGIRRAAESRLRNAPVGYVRILKHRKGFQFFLREDPKDRSGKYIHTSERQLAYSLIQKSYDEKILKAVRKQADKIGRFLRDYDPAVFKNIYSRTGDIRKQFLSAVELPDREYVENWLKYTYKGKEFPEGTPEHYSENGERVRSKSEVLIADALLKAGIPYRYECPLDLGGRIIHPDFTVLRIRDRKEVYWEHLGMADDEQYLYDAILRIRQYEKNGIFPGDGLILTAETNQIPLNRVVIDRMIGNYFSYFGRNTAKRM